MRDALAAIRTTLTELQGLGTVLAAKVIGHAGNVSRSPPSTTSPVTPAAHPWTFPAATTYATGSIPVPTGH